MPRNGSGTYSLPAGNPVVSGTTIQASWANSTLADISTELTGSLARNGAGGMLGALRGVDGTVSVPAFSFTSETTSGFYRAGTGDVRFAMAGADIYTVTSTGVGIGTTSIGSGTRLEIRSANTITDSRGILAINSTNAAAANLGGSISFGGETGQATTPYVFGAISGRYEGSGYAGYLQLSTTTSGGVVTERARIDSSGNLGLGVTPSAWSGVVAMQLPTGAALTGFSNTTNLAQNAYYNGSWRYISTAAAALAQVTQGAHQWFTAPSGTAGAAISFTQAMTLDSSGNLLVGLSSPTFVSTRLEVQAATNNNALGARTTQNNYAPLMAWNSATTGDNLFQYFYTEGTLTLRGSITYNRAGGLVAYNTTSDYRAKDIIGPVQDPGATIDALKVYEGVMKGATQSRPMLIAHEAQEHVPFCVSGQKDEENEDGSPKFQQMDHASLVPLLIAEIQSLRARVAALEAA